MGAVGSVSGLGVLLAPQNGSIVDLARWFVGEHVGFSVLVGVARSVLGLSRISNMVSLVEDSVMNVYKDSYFEPG